MLTAPTDPKQGVSTEPDHPGMDGESSEAAVPNPEIGSPSDAGDQRAGAEDEPPSTTSEPDERNERKELPRADVDRGLLTWRQEYKDLIQYWSAADAFRYHVLDEAASSPKAALMLLAAGIERQMRELAAVTGRLPTDKRISTTIPHLARHLALPPEVQRAVSAFQGVRNRIVHGRDADDDEILRAIDAGLTISAALGRIPREMNYVEYAIVDVFADSEGRRQRPDVHGVMLRTVSSETPPTQTFRVFPTRRDSFRVGEPVAWEWSLERSWPESWYRHPATGDIHYGWTTSAEFIGRHLADI